MLWILGATFLISLIAFVGALTLVLKEKLLSKVLLILVALSAGALIGGAFLHLLPEAIVEAGGDADAVLNIFLSLLFGFCLFFVMEQFIRWHHHHGSHDQHNQRAHQNSPLSFSMALRNLVSSSRTSRRALSILGRLRNAQT